MSEERRTLSEVLKDLGESSSLHGIPKIISSRQKAVKVLWCLLLLGAVSLSTYTIVGLFDEYYSYPVKTTVSLKYETLPFPAITICNSNPIRLSKLSENEVMNNVLLDKIDSESKSTTNPWDAIGSLFDETFDALENDTYSDEYSDYDNSDEDRTRDEFEAWRERVLAAYKALPFDTRVSMGHQLDDMMHQLTFRGYQYDLTPSQTTLIQSPLYGNCFTIDLKAVSQTSGPSKGLRMILNVETSEYIEHFVTGSGIRLSIHEPGTIPLPDQDSIILNPGYETNIGLKMIRIKRLGGNYGQCTNGHGYQIMGVSEYSVALCHAECRRDHIHVTCGCIPFDSPDGLGDVTICSIDIDEDIECVSYVESAIYAGQLACDCQPKCDEDTFSPTITGRDWPNINYLQYALMVQACRFNISSMNTLCDELKLNGTITPETYDKYASTFLSVNIYFDDLNFEIIAEEPLYTTIRFLSDLGGAMGFYMGASLLTYVEILQLLLELGLFCKSKMTSKPTPSSILPVKPM